MHPIAVSINHWSIDIIATYLFYLFIYFYLLTVLLKAPTPTQWIKALYN